MKGNSYNMKRSDAFPRRSVRRINLSLPVVQKSSYEIYCTGPPLETRQPSTVRPVSRQKPLFDIKNSIKIANTTPSSRLPVQLKNLTGPLLVNLVIDTPPIPNETASTVADSISNALISSGYSGQTLRTLPGINKCSVSQTTKDESEQSQVSSIDRLLFESVGSFEDPFMNGAKKGVWHNVNHPRLSTIKILHSRKRNKPPMNTTDMYSRVSQSPTSFGNFCQESMISCNERLYEKVEQLTKNYFPSIQQLRHNHPCPDLISNRLHLHREQKRDFVPILSPSHAGR